MKTGFISPDKWPVCAVFFSALMLAAAHAFEIFGHFLPCPLCLRQREVFWAAMAIAAAGFVAMKFWPSDRLTITVNMLLCLIFLTSVVIAGFHAGVEWKLWDGPSDCAAGVNTALPRSLSSIDLNQKFGTVSCSDAAWRLFGISMAGYNALISLALALASGAAAYFARDMAPRPGPSY